MRRRRALTALTGVLATVAGCNALEGDTADRPTFGVPDRTAGPNDAEAYDDAPAGPRTAIVTSTGVQRRGVVFDRWCDHDDVVPRATFLEHEPGEPLRVWVGVENRGGTDRELGFDAAVPLASTVGVAVESRSGGLAPDDDGRTLRLVPTTDPAYEPVRPTRRTTGCWRTDEPPVGPDVERSVTLDTGQAVGQTYELLTPSSTVGCLPPGVYRFDDGDGVGLTLSLWRPTIGPPASTLSARSFPELRPTDWFHEARNRNHRAYLEPGSERFEAPRSVEFALHNYSRFVVGTDGYQLLRSNGEEWLTVVDAAGESADRRLVLPGQNTSIEVGFGTGDTLRELRAGYYAVRWLVAEPDPSRPPSDDTPSNLAAVVHVTDGTDPTLSTDRFDGSVWNDGETVRLRSPANDVDEGAVLVVRRGGPPDAPTFPLERVLRFEALANALSYLVAADGVPRVRLETAADRAARAIDAVSDADGRGSAFSFDDRVYTLRREE